VFVADVFEIICAVVAYKHLDGSGLDGVVTPAVIVDASQPVDIVDEFFVPRRPPNIKVRQLEVVPEDCNGLVEPCFEVMPASVGVHGRPEAYIARRVIEDYPGIAVLNATVAHQSKDVVTDR